MLFAVLEKHAVSSFQQKFRVKSLHIDILFASGGAPPCAAYMGYYHQLEPWVFAPVVFSVDKQRVTVFHVGSLGGSRPQLKNLTN